MSAQTITTIVGNTYHSTVTFDDGADSPTLIDPEVVVFAARTPTGLVIEHAFGDDDDPNPVVRVSQGRYAATQPLTVPGSWYMRWEGEGDLTGAAEERVNVRPSRVRT